LSLDGFDFRGMNLENFDFSSVSARKANFSKANLNGAKFINAMLVMTNFSGASLVKTNFESACLVDANFTKAKGRYAILKNTELSGSKFVNADFTSAIISGSAWEADFTGCDFSKAKFGDFDYDSRNMIKAKKLPFSFLGNFLLRNAARREEKEIGGKGKALEELKSMLSKKNYKLVKRLRH